MPTISMFRGIKVTMNWNEHQPPHFHATYGGVDILISIKDLEVIEGNPPSKNKFPAKQLKMLIGWAAFHQEELMENWELARQKQELFAIEPMK